MISSPMCLSIFQNPRCKIYTVASFWSGVGFQSCWTRRLGTKTNSKLHSPKTQALEVGVRSKKWTRRPVTTKAEESNRAAWSSKANSIKNEILKGTVLSSSTSLETTTRFQKIQYCDILEKTDKDKEIAKNLTVIVFDIETTGIDRKTHRIIEIALRDLSGGENSTFQTLVNPGFDVENSGIHGITSDMVRRPDVPRMSELLPILIQYIKSRKKPGGSVLLVAHNARIFDVPFLNNEFNRYGVDIPSDWLFLDTLPLARELMKSKGYKTTNLQSVREALKIELDGPAHRAMSDVNCLSLVFQRISQDLKLTLSDIVERSFSASDPISQKKKKS